MGNHRYKLQPDLIHRLVAAGCPLDIEEGAQDNTQAHPRGLLIRPVNGDHFNKVFDLDGWTGCMLDLEIASDVPGLVVIRFYGLDLPWQGSPLYWLPDPLDVGAKWEEYVVPGTQLVYPRNLVLNHRMGAQGKLRRGEILDGLLLGIGFEPLPDCFPHGSLVNATFRIGDQLERCYSSEVSLRIDRWATIDPARRKEMSASLRSRRRLLDKVDAV